MKTISQVRTLSEFTHERRGNEPALWCFVAAIFAVLLLAEVIKY